MKIVFILLKDRIEFFRWKIQSVDITSEFPVLWHNPDSHRNGIASPPSTFQAKVEIVQFSQDIIQESHRNISYY